MNKKKSKYLSTGIDHLDDILSPDRDTQIYKQGGILLGEGVAREQWETPIVIIDGITGTGKTNLALQIAHAAARDKECVVFFYSLEQTVTSLCRAADNFGAFQNQSSISSKVQYIDASKQRIIPEAFAPNEENILFCKFSPRVLNASTDNEVFDQRFSELKDALEKTIDKNNKETIFIFIIDGITAFSGKPLQRNEVHKIFSLFRQYHVPAIITSETYGNEVVDQESSFHEAIKFLSDIVISLSKEQSLGHLLYYLEIIKSRVGRQALGKHLYKIRTETNAKEIKTDTRKGIVVYPSIHYVLSRVRARTTKSVKNSGQSYDQKKYVIEESDKKDLGLLLSAESINDNASIAIIGANGTHKLALALNFGMGRVDNQAKLMLLNFGGTGQMDFKGVAWTEFHTDLRNIEKIGQEDTQGEIKYWHTGYELSSVPDISQKIFITSFKIGQLTPEECFDAVEYMLLHAEDEGKPFHSVLLNNTAEICTGFPYLKNEPLFIPTLLDLFYVHKVVSISIGVENDKSSATNEMNFALQANADYRIVLNHYPSVERISADIVESAIYRSEPYYEQQFVSILIDNVTGKHYMRHPKWLWVQEFSDPLKGKILHCDMEPKIMASVG